MKKAIALAAALLASSAQATSGLEFGDINYLLKSGQFNLTSNASVYNSEVSDSAFNPQKNYETNGYVIDNRLGFGLADNLNAFVGLDWAPVYSTELPGSRNSDNSGLSNPYFGGTYRLLNQNSDDINVDFGLVGRLNIMDAQTGFAGKSGNYMRGNHSVEANAAIGKKWNEANEWRVTVAAIQQFAGESKQNIVGGKQDYESDASTDFSITGAYQYRPVQEFMMLVSAQALRVGEATSKNTTSNFNTTEDAHTDLNFKFSAKYLITDNFIFKFNYAQSHLAEYDIKRGTNNAKLKDRHEQYYGFGLDWLF